MSRIRLAALICFLCVALGACSDDGGDDTGSNNDAWSDVGSDGGETDIDEQRDVASNDAQESDSSDSDATDNDGKVAIGEPCPSECPNLMGDTPYSFQCEKCANEYCYYPFDSEIGYCTIDKCNSQADCDELGEGLVCDEFDFCIPK